VILVDSSAWIEFLRGTRSAVCEEVDRLLDAETAISDPIRMEVLAGARDERHLHDLRTLLGRAHLMHCDPRDFDAAAMLYRRCRGGGQTIQRLIDCLIAAVAIREGLPILQSDSDFEVLARHTELAIHRA
jgi:predicted nucleic acid-binding protein